MPEASEAEKTPKKRPPAYASQEAAENALEAAKKRLGELKNETPPRRVVTQKSQIKALESDIRELLKSGWSAKEVAKALQESGINVNADTLKNTLYKIKKEREKNPVSTKVSTGKQKPDTPPPAPQGQSGQSGDPNKGHFQPE